MRPSLILGAAFALMASTALAATPAAVTFPLDPAATDTEATRAPAGLVLAADDDGDEGRGLLFRLGLRGDDGLSTGPSSREDDSDDDDEDDDDEDADDEDDDADDDDDDRGDDGNDNDGGSDGDDNDGGDDD